MLWPRLIIRVKSNLLKVVAIGANCLPYRWLRFILACSPFGPMLKLRLFYRSFSAGWSHGWPHQQLPAGEVPRDRPTARRQQLPFLLSASQGSSGRCKLLLLHWFVEWNRLIGTWVSGSGTRRGTPLSPAIVAVYFTTRFSEIHHRLKSLLLAVLRNESVALKNPCGIIVHDVLLSLQMLRKFGLSRDASTYRYLCQNNNKPTMPQKVSYLSTCHLIL